MEMDTLVFEPGSRYDLVIDFSDPALVGKRVIIGEYRWRFTLRW